MVRFTTFEIAGKQIQHERGKVRNKENKRKEGKKDVVMANAIFFVQVGILEPKYRVGQVQGQVIKADSAAKSLIAVPTARSASTEVEDGSESTETTGA